VEGAGHSTLGVSDFRDRLILPARGPMPIYFASHSTACLTKQALRQLMLVLLNSKEVKVQRCVSSQIGGRMVTEVEAPDQTRLEKFFQSHYVNCEWIMRIDLEGRDGTVAEY
jgi:hypothetical protein